MLLNFKQKLLKIDGVFQNKWQAFLHSYSLFILFVLSLKLGTFEFCFQFKFERKWPLIVDSFIIANYNIIDKLIIFRLIKIF